MTADVGGRRRERESGERRSERVGVAFTPAELAVVRAAAGREGMSVAGWVGLQAMAVAQHVLVPVSADRADVLRELVKARAGLREIAVRLNELGGDGTAVGALEEVLAEARGAVVRVDAATVAVMRERRSRT
ncbi:hypothetical protein CP980_34960 [Streptomyces vinaceus]|uniref:Uncharacterized protein n=1 Tax=Streptomyces vinaceus TaxID=1960 RepID=A0A5J6JPU1_STRVI|nr:hypothetical protein [Streptomyces vinaceus]QEV49528.1 hypothetical protein CP980_34960 [Streptomyces vinaceus]GHE46448.1 hypothetical protein GCM10017778_32970 [Streptomyces vinaceus]